MGKTKRDSSVDAVRGIAIILVMIGHVFVHNQMEDPYIYDFIKAVQMPLFMIISGYLCGQGRKTGDLGSYVTILKKRAIAYLVPFFFWLIVLHPRNILGAFQRILFELDFGLWFLAVLFILTFMVYTAQLFAGTICKKRNGFYELFFWGGYGCFCLILVMQILLGNRFLSPYLTIIYVPFYMLGYVAGDYGKRFFAWKKENQGIFRFGRNRVLDLAMWICFGAFIYLVAVKNLNSMESRLDTMVQMLASLLGSVAIIYGTFSWKDGKIKQFFAKIGCYTLEIYVIHYHYANVLNFHQRQFNVYTLEGAAFVVLSFVTMAAVTFAWIWVLKRIRCLNFMLFGK